MTRAEMLEIEISKAYRLAHLPVPRLEEIRMEAHQVSQDTREIPDQHICACYGGARVHGRSRVPTSRDVVLEWHNNIRPEIEERARRKVISHGPSHSCHYCVVVATRLGRVVPDLTKLEHDKAMMPVTDDEIECVLATVRRDHETREYWNTSDKSPYKGRL